MPGQPPPKPHAHPAKQPRDHDAPPAPPGPHDSAEAWGDYVELDVTSNYTFLTGASHPEEYVAAAVRLGYRVIGLADTGTLGGVVRAHAAAREAGVRLLVGCRLQLAEPAGVHLLVYPSDKAAYGRLCRLLTLGKRRAEKGECLLTLDDVAAHNAGLLAVLIAPAVIDDAASDLLGRLRAVFDDDRLSLGITRDLGPDDQERMASVARLAEQSGVPLAALGGVLHHDASRRALRDVLTCIRLGVTIDEAGYALKPHADCRLREPAEMARLLAEYPAALRRTVLIARRASGFDLGELRYHYPREVVPEGVRPIDHLRDLTARGARERYPRGVPVKVAHAIEHELGLIDELGYAHYFLTVYDLVVFARSRGILCQGRGAAANSSVCYCLGITSVDPDRIDLLFERFVSRERHEPPDIDIDFEHERREEVIQYIYARYGRERAALTAEVITYRWRSAVRDVGKALGLSLDCVDKLARTLDWWDAGVAEASRLRELGLDPNDRTIRLVMHLCGQILGFPRHRSQHVGGFVISDPPLCELVPIENAAMPDRTVIEWDKDDLDAMGMMKVDCLGLGMLTCVRKALDLVRPACGSDLTLARVTPDDPAVYDMICAADTVGVFQIESRAQMSMLPRLRPRCFYDLVIEVAIVRPGPIQGDMVHPYLRRRHGEEPVTYPSEEVRSVLGRTLGVPLFQEQAMKLAIVAAGFTPDEADRLRRAMAAWKRKGDLIYRFGDRLKAGMIARGYPREFAQRCFEQIKGFSEYGFPESHAASFAHIVYVSAWLKCHHPAAFAAALINSQPMGFYAPAQIVRDAREHGVEVRAVDVHHSGWDCTLEPGPGARPAIRLGLRLVRSLGEAHGRAVERARREGGAFASVHDLRARSGVPVAALRALARADAMASLGLDRQHALWAIQALRDEERPLLDDAPVAATGAIALPPVAPAQRVGHDYHATGLSLKAHPLSFARERLERAGVIPAQRLKDPLACPHGASVRVAGMVLVRQRPATASGIVFMTIEDETGVANLILRPAVFERCRAAARHSVFVIAHGRVERSGAVVHVQVARVRRLDTQEDLPGVRSRDFH